MGAQLSVLDPDKLAHTHWLTYVHSHIGPIWTPLIPATFEREGVAAFGSEVPMKRAGQPSEVAPAFVFLASNCCSSYMTGE